MFMLLCYSWKSKSFIICAATVHLAQLREKAFLIKMALQKQLLDVGIHWEEAKKIALDRTLWKDVMKLFQ